MNFFKKLFIKPTSTVVITESKADLSQKFPIPLQENAKVIAEEIIPTLPNNENTHLSEQRTNELIEMLAEEGLKQSPYKDYEFDVSDKDSLFEDAARLVVSSQLGSTSLLQRRMKLGYNRAGRIMDQLESAGIVGAYTGSASREVLISSAISLQSFFDTGIIKTDGNKNDFNLEEFLEKYKEVIENRRNELQKDIDESTLSKEKDEIRQELLERERKRKLQREVLKTLIDNGEIYNDLNKDDKREVIPQEVMDKVWNRDGGKCVQCGDVKYIEFDHIIPFSKGGATTYRNLQILCKKCNLEKSNKIG